MEKNVMKKQLLALAIGSMVVAPSVALADKGPTVYGKVNVSYENQDNGNDDQWELESNSSRLGVKGEVDLDVENVVAIYQAEFQVAVDDGDNGGQTFSQRNIYGGFKHANLGTLMAGKFDSPFKKSQGKIDQFGDLRGDINEIVGGSERVSNIIQYSTPKLADAITLNLAMIPGEGSTVGNDRRDGVADGFSTSADRKSTRLNSSHVRISYAVYHLSLHSFPTRRSSDLDQFGDLRGDINEIVGGSERVSNIIQYSTPKLADAITLNLAMIPGEGSTVGNDRRDGVADGFSTSAVFDNGTIYASVGYDSEIKTDL